MRRILKVSVPVVPWIVAAALPICMVHGFMYDVACGGSITLLPVFGFWPMMPFAPLMLFRSCLENPEATGWLTAFYLFAGAVLPLVVALLFARYWNRKAFGFVALGYLALVGFDAFCAMALLKGCAQ